MASYTLVFPRELPYLTLIRSPALIDVPICDIFLCAPINIRFGHRENLMKNDELRLEGLKAGSLSKELELHGQIRFWT